MASIKTCDINCDMGEGVGEDEQLMPYITSANIACGYHAGNEGTMREAVLLAKKWGVAIGAHPSLLDRENFGRTEVKDISPQEIYDLVRAQVLALKNIVDDCNGSLHHIKPHGALYNMAARDAGLSLAIARAVYDIDKSLVLYGLSGSHLIKKAKETGLKTASEVFADRTYGDDGNLTPRTSKNALIEDEEQALSQVFQMIQKGAVTTTSGNTIPIRAETICIHGDGKNAVAFAIAINQKLGAENILIKTI